MLPLSDAPRVPLPAFEQARIERQLATITFTARLGLIAALLMIEGSFQELSRDSAQYHTRAIHIAASQYATGNIHWDLWLDHGWQQLLGLVYHLFGPHLVIILLLNCLFVSMATVLIFRIGLEVFRSLQVAMLSAYVFTLFPSVVYYTALPLKEASAVLALSLIVWGTVQVKTRSPQRGAIHIICGLAIISMLRLYLVYVCAVCVMVCLLPINLRGGWSGLIRLGTCGLALCGVLVTLAVQLGVSTDQHESLRYFDLDQINDVRITLSSAGKSRFFNFEQQDQSSAAFGHSIANDVTLVGKGLFFYLFSIDIFNLGRIRQMAAIPEMLFFLYCIPYLYRGVLDGWKRFPERLVPVLLMALALITVYSSATTNMGAMYRWRMQSLPFLILLIAHGAHVRRTGILYEVMKKVTMRSSFQVAP